MNKLADEFINLHSYGVAEFLEKYRDEYLYTFAYTLDELPGPVDDVIMEKVTEYHYLYHRLVKGITTELGYMADMVTKGSTFHIYDGKLVITPETILAQVYYDLLKAMSEGKLPRYCKYCNAQFYDAHPKAKYCCHSCMNKAKTKRYRDSKKAAADVPPCRIIGR